MTQKEFQAIIDAKVCEHTVSEEDFKVINKVYAHHPSISETDGKNQIADLYLTYGMRIIMDMLPTAEKAQDFEEEILALRLKKEDLEKKYKAFKNGEDIHLYF